MIRKWICYIGVFLALSWCSTVFAGNLKSISPKLLQRLTLAELVHRIQNHDPTKEDLLIMGKELEDRMPTTISEVENLFTLIGKEKGQIRQWAINAVSNTLDSSLKPGFIRALTDKKLIVNAVAASMCGKLRIRKAADDLVKLIKRLGPISEATDNDRERVSIAAVLALGEIRDESKIPFLISRFKKMRGYEVTALIRYGKKAIPAMFRLIAGTDQDFERGQAERVLLSIRDPAAAALFKKEMENPDSLSRSISIRALLNINATQTLRRLLEIWEKEDNPIIASHLLDHIDHYRIDDSVFSPFSQKILRTSTNANFRKTAASILGRIGGKGAEKALQEALRDQSSLVRVFAARALRRLKPAPAAESPE